MQWVGLVVLVSANFMTILDLFIVNVSLQAIRTTFSATPGEIQAMIIAYNIPYGVLMLNFGRLGDRFGRRRMYLIGTSIFTAASLFCGLAWSPLALIIFRATQGIGAAAMMPQVYASLRVLFEGERRQKAFGVMAAVQGIAGIASQLVGGMLIVYSAFGLGWRSIFFVNIPIGALAIIGAIFFLPETREKNLRRLDFGGALIATTTLLLIIVPLLVGRDLGWPSWSLFTLALSIPATSWFFRYEGRISKSGISPILDVSLFRSPTFRYGVIASFLFYSAISSFSLSLTMLLQDGFRLSALIAGAIFTPSAISFFVGSLCSTQISKIGRDRSVVLGLTIFFIGLLASVLFGAYFHSCYTLLFVAMIFNGLGQGLVIPILLNSILSSVDVNNAGTASGTFSTVQILGATIGVALVGTIFFSMLDGHLVFQSEAVREATFARAFSVSTLYNATAVLLGILLFVKRDRNPLFKAS